METRVRSIVKAATWRTIGLIVTTTMVLVFTGKVELAASVGVADTLVKVVAFYGHERLWLRIRFGRPLAPEYEI